MVLAKEVAPKDRSSSDDLHGVGHSSCQTGFIKIFPTLQDLITSVITNIFTK